MSHEDLARIICSAEANPDDWLKAFFQLNGITYDYKTDAIKERGELLEQGTIMAQMRLCCFRNETTDIRAYLADALHVWKRQQAKSFIDDLRQQFSFQVSNKNYFARWVRAATGHDNPHDISVMQHFIWQVKRKLNGLPVDHHLMPVLYGKTGGGKSVAIHKMLQPISGVSICRDMTVFSDSFGKRQFARNYIMFFDELAKSTSVDINALKNIITSPVIEWRVMRSEGVFSSSQNCTFIACSNDPVAERIVDPTSARRFWQVNCADRLDWELINSIDYTELWRSVDEFAECPLMPHLSEIQAIQHRELRAKDLIEQWLEFTCEPSQFTLESPTTNVLFASFMEWCQWQGIASHPGIQKFSRSLESKMKVVGWNIESKRTNRGTAWPLTISTSIGKNEMKEVT